MNRFRLELNSPSEMHSDSSKSKQRLDSFQVFEKNRIKYRADRENHLENNTIQQAYKRQKYSKSSFNSRTIRCGPLKDITHNVNTLHNQNDSFVSQGSTRDLDIKSMIQRMHKNEICTNEKRVQVETVNSKTLSVAGLRNIINKTNFKSTKPKNIDLLKGFRRTLLEKSSIDSNPIIDQVMHHILMTQFRCKQGMIDKIHSPKSISNSSNTAFSGVVEGFGDHKNKLLDPIPQENANSDLLINSQGSSASIFKLLEIKQLGTYVCSVRGLRMKDKSSFIFLLSLLTHTGPPKADDFITLNPEIFLQQTFNSKDIKLYENWSKLSEPQDKNDS